MDGQSVERFNRIYVVIQRGGVPIRTGWSPWVDLTRSHLGLRSACQHQKIRFSGVAMSFRVDG